MALTLPFLMKAQKETFSLTTYSPLKGWKRTATPELVQFMKQDPKKGTYCAISVFKAREGENDAQLNFSIAWKTIVKGLVPDIAEPEMQEPASANGWEAVSGNASFEAEGTKGVAMLITSTSGNTYANILVLTNSDAWNTQLSAFLESVAFNKPVTRNAQPVTSNPQPTTSSPLLGTWIRSGSINPAYADPVSASMAGYNTYQYTFNSNGTYTFYIKNFRMTSDKLLLVRESGTFVISGDKVTLNPAKSVIETWTQKNRGDEFGKYVNSQARTLEKTTYQFTKYYFSGIQEWNLVLLADKPTLRDGPFSNNKTFPNAWYFKAPGANTETIKLPN